MNARLLNKASSILSISMIVIAMALTLLMVWVDLSSLTILSRIWGSIATLFVASASVSVITREMIRTAVS
tara:strand:- start:4614 stop:4823 length:210 start_codon:yes stop_codon:yes gene_type:complete